MKEGWNILNIIYKSVHDDQTPLNTDYHMALDNLECQSFMDEHVK